METPTINMGLFIVACAFFVIALITGLVAMTTAKNPRALQTTMTFGLIAAVTALIGVGCSYFVFN